jgi:hypothetical protein
VAPLPDARLPLSVALAAERAGLSAERVESDPAEATESSATATPRRGPP